MLLIPVHSTVSVGTCCGSLNFRDVIAALERLVEDESLRRRVTAARVAALEQELGLSVMLRRCSEFSGINLSALRDTLIPLAGDDGVR